MQAISALARSVAKSAPRDYEDPALVLAATGKDPGAIVSWVRTNTRLLPYSGMLRGAGGVLMDRAGNSLDRALFTADLLQRAGHVVRLARTTLPPDRAAALRASIAAGAAAISPPRQVDRATLRRVIGQSAGFNADSVDRAVDVTLKGGEQFQSTIRDLYEHVMPAVQAAVGQDATRDREMEQRADASLKDHFWVQRQTPNGWEDLDPESALVGTVTPQSTFVPSDTPGDLKHRVTMRVVVESWATGKPAELPLLERTWTAADLAGKSITLRHRLLPEPAFDSIAKGPNPQAAYLDALSSAWVVEPVLSVGSEEIMDRLFTLSGESLPANGSTLRQLGVPAGLFGGLGTRVASGGAMGAIAGLFGDAPPPAPSGAPNESGGAKVTAEWLDFEIAAPDRPLQRQRRTIFDLVGAATRAASPAAAPVVDRSQKQTRALALTSEIDVFVFGATPAEPWIRRTAAIEIVTAAENAIRAVRSGTSALETAREGSSDRLTLPLWSWALNRAKASSLRQAWPVAPNVVLLWSIPSYAGETRLRRILDVVANPTTSDLTFSGAVAQGVFDTITEYAVLNDGQGRWNAAALHARDLAASQPWVRLNPDDPSAAGRLDIPADAKARIRDDLSRGYIVLARPRPGAETSSREVAWWRIDPRTGATLGIGEAGFGTSMAEYAALSGRGLLCTALYMAEIGHAIAGGQVGGGLKAVAFAAFCAIGIAGAASAGIGAGGIIGEGVVELLIELITEEE